MPQRFLLRQKAIQNRNLGVVRQKNNRYNYANGKMLDIGLPERFLFFHH